MKAPLYSKEGKKKREVVLNPEVYGIKVNERLLQLVNKAYSANQRSGTASTKERKEVRGGGRKPWKQKGTGRARAGSTRSPLWRGGGTTFGPRPRDYSVDLPQKMRLSAIVSALSKKATEKNVLLLEDVSLSSAKTKEWASLVGALPIQHKRALCVVKEFGDNLKFASRNIKNKVDVRKVQDLNAYHILQREKLLIAEDALPALEERLLKGASKQAEAKS